MSKSDHRQEAAVAALISSKNISEAAQVAGIGERTLYSWLNEKDFREAYRSARRVMVQQALTQLQRVSSLAVNTLAEIMEDTEAPAGSRVNASKAVLELAVKAVELEDIMARLENLEEEVRKHGR